MYRLIEISMSNDKESPALYPYETFEAMEADYETKLGAAMKSNQVQAELLIMLGGSLETLKIQKVGDANLSPRLIELQFKEIDGQIVEQEADMGKYDTELLVSANFHSKLGSAMKKNEVKIEVLKGINGNGDEIEYRSWMRPTEPQEEQQEEPTPEPEKVTE